MAVGEDQEVESKIQWRHRGAGGHGDRWGGQWRWRGSKTAGVTARWRQRISTVEAVDGGGSNIEVGMLSDVYFHYY